MSFLAVEGLPVKVGCGDFDGFIENPLTPVAEGGELNAGGALEASGGYETLEVLVDLC